MPEKQIRKNWSLPKSLPGDIAPAVNGAWVIATAEIPPEDERGGDIVRVGGMRVPKKLPLLAQHLHHAPDGSPTILGSVVEFRDALIPWEGKAVKARLARFEWADTEYANKYKELWGKHIDTVSIGAMVKQAVPLKAGDYAGGFDYTDTELYELSIVTVPANPAATQLAAIKSKLGAALDYEVSPIEDDDDEAEEDVDIVLLRGQIDDLRDGLADLTKIVADIPEHIIKSFTKRFDDFEGEWHDRSDGAQPSGRRRPVQEPSPVSTLQLQALLENLRKIDLNLSNPTPTK
jgi:hypothetical protein